MVNMDQNFFNTNMTIHTLHTHKPSIYPSQHNNHILIRIVIIKIKFCFKFKAYTSVGCFGSSCTFDVFKEIVDSSTCYNMAVITWATCYRSCTESGIFLGSDSMTIEMCLQACTSQGFVYAAINMFEKFKKKTFFYPIFYLIY